MNLCHSPPADFLLSGSPSFCLLNLCRLTHSNLLHNDSTSCRPSTCALMFCDSHPVILSWDSHGSEPLCLRINSSDDKGLFVFFLSEQFDARRSGLGQMTARWAWERDSLSTTPVYLSLHRLVDGKGDIPLQPVNVNQIMVCASPPALTESTLLMQWWAITLKNKTH